MLSVRIKLILFGVMIMILSILIGYAVVTPLLINIETNQYIDEVNGQYKIYESNNEHFRNDVQYAILLFQQTNEIYTDSSNFTNYLSAYDDGFEFDPTLEEQSIILSMFDFALINRNVESIYIGYDETGALVRTAPIQDDHDSGLGYNYDPREQAWYKNAVTKDGGFAFNDIEKNPSTNTYFSTISITLSDFTDEFIGVLGINIDFETYMENFTQVDGVSRGQFIFTQGDKAVVINDDGTIEISDLNDVYDGLDYVTDIYEFHTQEIELDGTNYLSIVSPLEDTTIRLVHLISDAEMRSIIMAKVTNIRMLFIGISLLLISAMLVIQEFLVLRPLGGIHSEIRDYKQSNITSYFRFTEDNSKEFVQIASILNEMVDTINDNMNKMAERISEMKCLYLVTNLAYKENKVDNILQGTAHAIVDAMKFSEDAYVHIHYKDRDYYSQQFEPSEWKLSTDLYTNEGNQGYINVYYLTEHFTEEIGPFENEEQQLLDTIASTLTIALTYRK